MAITGSGRSMQRPEWASIIRSSPDYDNERVVIVDAQTYLDLLGRGAKRKEVPGLDRWNDDLLWLFNSPRSEVRIKMNTQIYSEIAGEKVPASLLATQKAFIDDYRATGKIIFDTGSVPFFAAGRQSVFTQVRLGVWSRDEMVRVDLKR